LTCDVIIKRDQPPTESERDRIDATTYWLIVELILRYLVEPFRVRREVLRDLNGRIVGYEVDLNDGHFQSRF